MPLMRPTASTLSLLSACRGHLYRNTGLLRTPAPHSFRPSHYRLQSTSSSKPASPSSYDNWSPSIALPRRVPLKVAVPIVALATGTFLYNVSDSFRHSTLAMKRCMIAGEAVVAVGIDYKYSLDLANRDLQEGNPEDDLERLRRKSALHKRSAERLREMLRKNGGIYIKLVSDACFIVLGNDLPQVRIKTLNIAWLLEKRVNISPV